MTSTETECRRLIWNAEQRLNYERLLAWHADPANAERAAEINATYVAAMQRDRNLD